MNAYRICWIVCIENEIVMEGRSLVYASNREEAIQSLIYKKCREYHLKLEWFKIESVTEFNHLHKRQ